MGHSSLKSLHVGHRLLPGHMSTLTKVLAGGVAPSFEQFYFNEGGFNEDDMISLAHMVETRARVAGCKKFILNFALRGIRNGQVPS